MRFSADWHEEAVNVAPEERATVADLKLLIDGQNVSMHLAGNETRDHITVSLYSLAEGLAHDWWLLFGGRDREVSLLRHRGGYAVPDVRLKFDGGVFEIHAQQKAYRNPDVRFWGGATEIMGRAKGEAELSEFIEEVLSQLNKSNVCSTSAALRWARVKASREDPDEQAFCEAAGALGLDPYEIPEAAADTIERASELFDHEPLVEFLAGAPVKDQGKLIDWVGQAPRRPHFMSRVAELEAIARTAADASRISGETPAWKLGYRRARSFRSAAHLSDNTRFSGFRGFAEHLGASRNFRLAPPIDGIRLLRDRQHDGVHLHMRDMGGAATSKALYLFTFARGVADAVCFPDDRSAPINELHFAYRQAAGRAFAAEVLAPVNEVMSMLQDGRDVATIADEFNVSTTTIERQIENRSRIEEACAV